MSARFAISSADAPAVIDEGAQIVSCESKTQCILLVQVAVEATLDQHSQNSFAVRNLDALRAGS